MAGCRPPARDGGSADGEDLRSERRFRLLAEAIPQIVWTTGPDGYCDYQNSRWLDYSGMTAEESAGTGWIEAVHPDDRGRCSPDWAGIARAATGFESEYRLRRADGIYRWFLSRAEPICDDEGRVVRWFGTCTDIDDRKRAEDARLRENEERLRLAAEAARLGYWDWDIPADRITWSESLAETSGIAPDGFGGTIAGFLNQVHPEDRERIGRAMNQAIEGGAEYEVEFRLVRPDGSLRWAMAKGRVYYDREGRAVRMSGIDIDITASKEAEARLRRSEERFRASIDTLIDCLAIHTAVRDERGRIVDFRTEYVNPPACRMHRLSREEQLGRGLLEILPAHRESGLFEKYCRVVETGEPLDIEEMAYEDVGGERRGRVVAIRVSKLGDGYVAAWRDVTARRATEEALQGSLDFASRIAEISPAVLYIYDLDVGRHVYHNREVASLLGYSRDEDLALGRDAVSRLMHPDDRSRCPDHFSRVRRLEGGKAEPFEYRMRAADGGWRWFYSLDSVFARDAEGKVVQIIGAAVDITDRKRAELALLASDERFRLAAEAVGGIIYEWCIRSDRVERTAGLAALTGFRPEEAEPTVGWWRSRVHPDDLEKVMRGHEASIARREPIHEEQYRVLHQDGSYRHVWDRARCVYDEEGRLCRVVGFTIDITALHLAEARLRRFADSDIIGVIFGDVRGGISYANDEFLRIIGYSRAEFESGRIGWADVTPPEWLPVDAEAIARARAGEGICPPYEKEYVRNDGSRIPVLVGFSLFGDGETVAFILDITERKRAEREIRRLNHDLGHRAAVLQTLFDVLPVGIAIAEDPACLKVRVNPAFARMLRIPPGANASLTAPEGERPETFKVYKGGEELAPEALPMQVAAARGVEFHDFEVDVLFPDGSAAKLLEYVSPLLGEDGRPRGSVGAFLDITARKRAEDALKAADRRKDEFLAMLAHELRNPLAALSNAFCLVRTANEVGRAPGSAYDIIERQLQNLVRLIDDLLDVSRITSGKIRLQMDRIDASAVVARAVESVRAFLERREHRLSVAVAPGPMPIQGDPTRLEQVLANLLNNAAKYSDRGSKIAIVAEPDGGEVVFRVRDTGIGIAPEMLPRIFEMFAQADSSIDRAHGGLGIGLTLARSLTEMHGGTISARSEGRGRGSEFTVRIPLRIEAPTPGTPGATDCPDDPPSPSRPRRILLVDDNADTLWSLAMLLQLNNHEVVTASDGPSAVEAARKHRPEVVVLDLGLPGMTGFEVAEVLRRDGMTEAILIAASGYAQEKDRERSRRAGFDHHLSKPVDIDALSGLIERRGRPSA